jgi:diguanylate cyclase (GGDEF)-like protein/PAS domain S-box-containing protein
MPRRESDSLATGDALVESPDTWSLAQGHSELLARIPAIVYVADIGAAARFYYVSPQIEQILGYSPEEWCADPGLWAARLHPDDRDRVLADEQSSGDGKDSSAAAEYRMLHRNGRVVWIRDDARLVRADGKLRWHGVLSDVSDRKQAELELERLVAQQAAVARFGEHALERAATTDLMQEATELAVQLLDVEFSGVAELLADQGYFVLRSGCGWPQDAIGNQVAPAGTKSQAGFTIFTILTASPVIVSDWATERRFERSAVLSSTDTRSGASVLIEGRSGPFGVLGVQSMTAREYTSGDVDFLQSLANVLAAALERQSIEDDIRHRALHDPLTGLPNRVLFGDRLDQALERLRRRPGQFAILFLDLDRFKLVNDSLGHRLGDELLVEVALRLRQAIRAADTVARFGGDEFGLLLEDVAGEHDAIGTAERIAALFAKPFVIAGREHFVTASIGIVFAQGGEDSGGLIRDADAAMYRAKERGRARYEVFDGEMRERAITRLQVESDLRHAIGRDELRLAYQPIVSLATGAPVGVEALLRWEHPQGGPVSPYEFISVAEENGLIEPIGYWVLASACQQAAAWHRQRPDEAPLAISVNISAKQLDGQRLPQAVSRLLAEFKLDPACLYLEITESVMVGAGETLAETLQALKRIGVQLVLDDFGTGYSSFGYLTRLPLDVLKIDRSYIDGLGTDTRDTAITQAIIAMANALSLQVIAEGVETAVHAAELRRLGCKLAQGFYFGRPMEAPAITAMIKQASASPRAGGWLTGSASTDTSPERR